MASAQQQQEQLNTPQTAFLLDLQTPMPQNRKIMQSPTALETTKAQSAVTDDFTPCLLDLDDDVALSPLSLPMISSRELKVIEDKHISDIDDLKARLVEAQKKVLDLECDLKLSNDTNKTLEKRLASENQRLESVAKELHVQYSRKHELKISALKKQIELKWVTKTETIERELEDVKEQLQKEREEKNDLVMYWDQFLEAEKNQEI